MASELSSVEKISRWHKLEKGGQDRYMEKMGGYNTIVFRF